MRPVSAGVVTFSRLVPARGGPVPAALLPQRGAV